MELVIYRDKETNEIKNFHEMRNGITQEKIDAYNLTAPNKAEIVKLEEDSLEYYFYKMKVIKKNTYYEDLRDLEDTLRDIASNIDDRLSEIENLCKEQE